MSKPYIDQSTGENNQKEFSIHGLSERQFKCIQKTLHLFTSLIKTKDKVKLDELVEAPSEDTEFDDLIIDTKGIIKIISYDIK